MKALVEAFPNHLRHSIEIARNAQLKFPSSKENIHNIVISGLGGSGIGGKIVSQILSDSCDVPIACVNDYVLPSYVGKN